MVFFSTDERQEIGFQQARMTAKYQPADNLRHPLIVSWYNHFLEKGSIDQECDRPWETWGKTRGGVRVDVGECDRFVVGDAELM